MNRIQKKLNKISDNTKGEYFKDAEHRVKNRKWLRYSSKIARRIISIIEDRQDLNQVVLAKEIGVSPQYINKVIKGHQNLSLETIGKLSEALDFELISFPDYKYSYTTPVLVKFNFLVIDNDSTKSLETSRVIQTTRKLANPFNINTDFANYNTLPITKKYTETLPLLEVGKAIRSARNS